MRTIMILAILVLTLVLPAEVAKADFTFGTPNNLGPTDTVRVISGYQLGQR